MKNRHKAQPPIRVDVIPPFDELMQSWDELEAEDCAYQNEKATSNQASAAGIAAAGKDLMLIKWDRGSVT
ncbi:MAG TPA: hypothetical protein VFF81_04295 [Noviherbaspirillum sp.]|nr:hypothetical protein [Noviherbaspirillum sp.]